jgi:hypothetical protein
MASEPRAPGGSPYLVPASVLLGFGLIAIAIYASRSSPPVAAPGAPERVAVPVERGRPASTPPAPPPPSTPLLPPEQTFTTGAFHVLWKPHVAEGAKRCKLDEHVKVEASTKQLEIPLALSIGADGRVEEATVAGAARTFAMDGTLGPGGGGDDLSKCYAAAVKDWVRFAPASAGGRLAVQVRAVDR